MPDDDRIDIERVSRECRLARFEYHESLDSTQQRAAMLAAEGERGPLVVVADEQTAGRGRGGNHWWTGRGSLAFSLLVDPRDWHLPAEAVPARSLAAGVAVVAAVQMPALYPHNVGLHWPNDVYVAGRKLSGILIDVLGDGRHIVGIGLNVNNSFAAAPTDVRQRGTSMFDLTSRHHDRTSLLAVLVDELASMFVRSSDEAALGRQFQELCMQVDRWLEIAVGDRIVEGRCLGVGTDGALLLDTATGVERLYSGVTRSERASRD